MKRLSMLLLSLLLLPALPAFGQSFFETTLAAIGIKNVSGVTIQYSFPIARGFWKGNEGPGKCSNYTQNSVAICEATGALPAGVAAGTVGVYLIDSHDVCGHAVNCWYWGALSGFTEENVQRGNVSFLRYTADLVGTFGYGYGWSQDGVVGRLYFETFPATDYVYNPSAGDLTIVLTYN